jgi:hypothetical protein
MMDGDMLALHEPNTANTTEVGDCAGFLKCKVTKVVDCASEADGIARDFTPAEIETPRTREVFATRVQSLNGK